MSESTTSSSLVGSFVFTGAVGYFTGHAFTRNANTPTPMAPVMPLWYQGAHANKWRGKVYAQLPVHATAWSIHL